VVELAIPPPELCEVISGRPDLDGSAYLSVGECCAKGMQDFLVKRGLPIERFESILDFGCGAGRVIRHVPRATASGLFGCDINARLIDWCQRHLPFAQFSVNLSTPPLQYADSQFDFAYVFSVFTHLSEAQQDQWFEELSRVLSPRGHLLFTTHGRAYVDVLLEPEHGTRFANGELVVFNPVYSGSAASYGECNAFHPEGYLRTIVESHGFEVIDFRAGHVIDREQRAIEQDMWLTRKI
jgi:SAM-dependent methyltransferase